MIHRDLKPSNILVDETGQPKVLDFGVARVTDSDTQLTRQTDLGQLVGTLAYMSPEQVLGDPLALDTRSDVYALGVILYELLAGKLPYSVDQKPLHEAVRIIREVDAAPLGSIDRSYRGDIATIAAKALEKDKTRRYASAADLADDIRRYLADEPIAARPASATYQLRKFGRRHRALVVGAAAVFLVLIAGAAASSWEALRARQERNAAIAEKRRADAEAATAAAINDFFQNELLVQASPDARADSFGRLDANLKVRTALDRAVARIAGKFDQRPEVEAAIRDTIGQTYTQLGLYPQARQQLQRALDLYSQVPGVENPKTLKTMSRLGFTDYLDSEYAEAESLLSRSLSLQRRVLRAEHPDTLESMNSLALAYYALGKFPQAETLARQTLQGRQRVLGPQHSDTLWSMNGLASVYNAEGKYEQAEALDRQTVDMQRRVLGHEYFGTLVSMTHLAFDYAVRGKYDQAEDLFQQTLAIERRTLGPQHTITCVTLLSLARMHELHGQHALAGTYAAEALAGLRHTLGSRHELTMGAAILLGASYLFQRRLAESERLEREAFETDRKVRPDDWFGFLAEFFLGQSLAWQKRYAEAEPLLLEGYRGLVARKERIEAPSRRYLDLFRGSIAMFYQAWGKPEKAAEFAHAPPNPATK